MRCSTTRPVPGPQPPSPSDPRSWAARAVFPAPALPCYPTALTNRVHPMKLANFRIGQRLAAAFGLVMLMALASAGLGVYQLSQIQSNLDRVVEDSNVKIALSHQMNNAIHQVL